MIWFAKVIARLGPDYAVKPAQCNLRRVRTRGLRDLLAAGRGNLCSGKMSKGEIFVLQLHKFITKRKATRGITC